MKSMLGQDEFSLFQFLRVSTVITYHMLMKNQYTCEATIVPSIALDEGVIMSLVSPWPFNPSQSPSLT